MESVSTSHSELLDRIYRLQRHIYDVTRKYFLFGRDTLVDKLVEERPKTILEVGCGTGRNLSLTARKLPDTALYGLDASQEMLKHARKNTAHVPSVKLEYGFAESFSGAELFQQDTFDAVFFSYSLTMIPDWKGAIQNGLQHLSPGGSLWIVDFWDQKGYPPLFQKLFQFWLALFHVRFDPNLLEELQSLEEAGEITLTMTPVGSRYAYIAKVQKATAKSAD